LPKKQADLSRIIASFAGGQYNISVHGIQEMLNDNITTEILEQVLEFDVPEIIEDYPKDPRGASCLILAWAENRQPIHTCIGYGGSMPLVITTYRPDMSPHLWEDDYRTRRRR